MILLGLMCYTLDFGVVIRWRMVLQEHLNWIHPIIRWFLISLANDHKTCFIDWFCWLTEVLINFSIMASDWVVALEEAIHVR
jgi:hypothetical protein